FGVIIAAVGWLYVRMPSAFLPEEDQGYFITAIQLPVGATDARTAEVIRDVEEYFAAQPEVENYFTVSGFSFNGRGQNSALAFIRLKPWEERKGRDHKVQAVIGRAMMGLGGIKDAFVYPLNPAAIPELGNSSGFD